MGQYKKLICVAEGGYKHSWVGVRGGKQCEWCGTQHLRRDFVHQIERSIATKQLEMFKSDE